MSPVFLRAMRSHGRLVWPRAAVTGMAVCVMAARAAAPAPVSVHLEEMTSPELKQRIAAGATTALIPIGGTEQNGAHLVLGKHNARVRLLAGRIATALGDAVVAPVLAYVPEGRIDPPTEHMRWPGTLSISDAAFEAVLEGAAASLCHHGLRDVILLGDHGGYQGALQRVAKRAQRPDCRVTALAAYYRASQAEFTDRLAAQGHAAAEIGTHAGLADTALALAVSPDLVRADAQARGSSPGVAGDPRRATAAIGEEGLALIVERSVAAIQAQRGRGR